jgi:hypothetical protein
MEKQWKARSSLAIFISALHLLDLDTLPDWPSITASTFHSPSNSKSTSQNLQARIKATEWALYHLFQLYSPESTRQVLSPAFPPKTPIQSLNLRTGLFKLLTELKKNALLPRETILRKTMLDECKGDKFEDVLASFSMLVLRKVLADGKGPVLSICKSARPEHVVPLIIAHRVSLQNRLQKREKSRVDARLYSKSLEARRADLAVRLHALSQPEEHNDEDASRADDDLLREKVIYAFAADPRWARYLFEGGTAHASASSVLTYDTILKYSFEDPAAETSAIEQDSSILQANQPMSQLKEKVSQHQDHIQHLKALQASLLSDDTTPPAARLAEDPRLDRTTKSPEKATIQPRFTRHKVLILASISV